MRIVREPSSFQPASLQPIRQVCLTAAIVLRRNLQIVLFAVSFTALPAVAAEPAAISTSPVFTQADSPSHPGEPLTPALPDAPVPQSSASAESLRAEFTTLSFLPAASSIAVSSSIAAPVSVVAVDSPNRILTPRELDAACQSGQLRGKPCRVSWGPVLWQAFESTTLEDMGNIALDSDTRNALTTHPFLASWFKCVHQYRYRQWSDDTTFVVHNIGHPMQGAGVYSIYDQNDPKERGLLIRINGKYWRDHLKAMAVVTLYEIQWKIGPASEASIGNSGYNTYYTPSVVGRTTNETGFQDFVITPVYGLGWHITEDVVDRFVMPHIWKRTHNKVILGLLTPLTPCRNAANILRYKPPYYRDYPLTPLRDRSGK